MECVPFDRGDAQRIRPGLVEVDDGDMAGSDRGARPPDGGSAEIHHTEVHQARNATAELSLPTRRTL
jgi:hypothetical protein